MTKLQSRVKSFMSAVGQATPDTPSIPDNLTRVLVVSTLFENAIDVANQLGIEVSCGDLKLDIDAINYDIL